MSHRGDRTPYRVPTWLVRAALGLAFITLGVLILWSEVTR